MHVRRITIVNIRRPKNQSLNDELQWFGSALGLLGERDKDRSCFRIFIELIKALKESGSLSSDELGDRLGLSRATVVHHLNTLMERGIIVRQGNRYIMRGHQLTLLVEDIRKDVDRAFEELKKTAEELDKVLDL